MPMLKLEFEVPEWFEDETSLGQHVTDTIAKKLLPKVEQDFCNRLWDALQQRALNACEEAVEKVLAEGWQQTDKWGAPIGEKKTLKQMILQVFDSPSSDSPYYDRKNAKKNITAWVEAAVEKEMKEHLAQHLKRARDEAKKALEEGIGTKIRDAIRTALRI